MSTMKYREEERQVQKDKRREEILDITMKYFLTVGVDNTKMSDIAKEAKISRKTLYQYFSSKEKIALALELKVFRQYVDMQCKIGRNLKGNGYERLEQYFVSTEKFIKEYQHLIRFTGIFDYYFSGEYADEGFYDHFIQIIDESKSVTREIIELGLADGSLKCDLDPLYLERTISDSILALAQRVTSRGNHLDEEHGIESFKMIQCQMQLFLAALKA